MDTKAVEIKSICGPMMFISQLFPKSIFLRLKLWNMKMLIVAGELAPQRCLLSQSVTKIQADNPIWDTWLVGLIKSGDIVLISWSSELIPPLPVPTSGHNLGWSAASINRNANSLLSFIQSSTRAWFVFTFDYFLINTVGKTSKGACLVPRQKQKP